MSTTGKDAGQSTYELSCTFCGEAFTARRPQARTCSSRCRTRASAERQRADGRLANQAAKATAKRRAEAAAAKARRPDRACEICGVAMVAADVRRRYCSEECGSKAFYARRIADGRMSQVMADRSAKRAEKKRPCTGCGKLLAYAHLEMPRCRDCGPARKSEVRIRAERRARSAARGVRRQRNLVSGCCVDCGSWWVSFHQSTRCKDCADHRVTDGMKAAKRRRKEREKGFKLTKFRRLAIFERDDWTCRICHAPIDRSATAPSPLAASIDHRVPLSVGGKHELANLQAAHFRCNVRKGNRERALVAPLRVAA